MLLCFEYHREKGSQEEWIFAAEHHSQGVGVLHRLCTVLSNAGFVWRRSRETISSLGICSVVTRNTFQVHQTMQATWHHDMPASEHNYKFAPTHI